MSKDQKWLQYVAEARMKQHNQVLDELIEYFKTPTLGNGCMQFFRHEGKPNHAWHIDGIIQKLESMKLK